MRPALTLLILILILGLAPALAQEASLDVGAELRRIEQLPTAEDRARASAVLARRPGVDIATVLAAIRAPREFAAVEPGAARERVALRVGSSDATVLVHLYVPTTYDADVAAPLLLALHGTGGSGANQIDPWRGVAEDLGMVVVAPDDHGENAGYTFSPGEREATLGVLRWARLRFHIDADRIHATGVSRGGHLTWDLALRNPDVFATISPMIGGPRLSFSNGQNNTRYVRNVALIPIRDLQGSRDDPRLLANLHFMFERLEALEATDAELIEFEGLGHSFEWGAVDWAIFLGEARRPAWPERAIRASARKDETRSFFVDVTKLDKGISEGFQPRIDPRKWAQLDEDARRREVLRQVEAATGYVDVRRSGPLSYEATGKGVRNWRLLVPAEALDIDEPVVVRWKARTIKRRPKADVSLLIADWVERLDPGFLPVAEIKL